MGMYMYMHVHVYTLNVATDMNRAVTVQTKMDTLGFLIQHLVRKIIIKCRNTSQGQSR